jgi:hypothetical protein
MKPDFICIGAQKAGTTWLYEKLYHHPDFDLPPLKEIHYFDRSSHYASPNHLAEKNPVQRMKTSGYTGRSAKKIIESLLSKNFKDACWWMRYSFCTYSDEWYESLFNNGTGLSGDITPSYSILKDSDVSKMYTLAPDAKIIFLLRNPIERAWSSYRHLKKLKPDVWNKNFIESVGTDIDFNDTDAAERFMHSPFQELRSNYVSTIDAYVKYFGKKNILIGFYDAISDNPQRLLSEILMFLGADPDHQLDSLDRIYNQSAYFPMPIETRRLLEEKYKPMIEELSSRYGGYPARWLQSINSSAENSFGDPGPGLPTIMA